MVWSPNSNTFSGQGSVEVLRRQRHIQVHPTTTSHACLYPVIWELLGASSQRYVLFNHFCGQDVSLTMLRQRHRFRYPGQEAQHVAFLVPPHLIGCLHFNSTRRLLHLEPEYACPCLRTDRHCVRFPVRCFPFPDRPYIWDWGSFPELGSHDPGTRLQRKCL